MLFRKKVEKRCAHCENGTELEDGQILCSRKGLRQPEERCWRFRYDPCKRIPKKATALAFSKYDQQDYSL